MLKRTVVFGSALAAVAFATATVRPTQTIAAPKRGEPEIYYTVKMYNANEPRTPRLKTNTQPRRPLGVPVNVIRQDTWSAANTRPRTSIHLVPKLRGN